MSEIQDLGDKIVRDFHPQRVILFGSHARGTAEDYSDVDLLVILPFEGKNFRKSLEILNHLDSRLPIDLLARRPDDVQRRYNDGDPLIREALNHGKVLYAQRDD
ncbi:MAG: nucleotidyltransferase domain-containing protein [Thermoguttaceae bacterium]|jgi:predicted nucleotidyltransferase